MRILLVEDDRVLADALARALALADYDLTILDIGLPRLSGLDVLLMARTAT